MKKRGFLGIDVGTQGLSVIFTDESLHILGVGEGSYDMVPGLPGGCQEQVPDDWEHALVEAMQMLRARLADSAVEMDVLAIGISGQMHGEVAVDDAGSVIGTARLWCDERNEAEGCELADLLQVKVPKRMTVARWLWTI